MTDTAAPRLELDRLQRRALVVGVVGLLLCLGGALLSPSQFFQSYLFAYLFWLGIALGCLAIVMLHHLTGGAWGLVIRRILEAAAMTLPLMAVLFVPLLFGLHDLYLWARPAAVASDTSLQHKSPYLNVSFFAIRTSVYFVVWIVMAYLLRRWSLMQDRTADPDLPRRLRLLSGPGLALYGLTVTFASVDWVMSLEPHWYSTIYGMLIAIGQWLTGMAFVIIILALLAKSASLADVLSPQSFHDLGNLLFAFIFLWGYIAFCQYLLVWSGNLPEETPWYLHRMAGGWKWIALILIAFHFAVPFLLLLSRDIKRSAGILSAVAAAIVFIHLVNQFWMVAPAFYPRGLHLHWLDFVAPAGIGGIWFAVFIWQLKGRALLPLHDPHLQEILAHETVEHG
jgi:hypothetical protein